MADPKVERAKVPDDKRRPGRPAGALNKPKAGIKNTAEFRDQLLASLTEKDIQKLPADLKAKLASSLVPKERAASEAAASFTLIISGIHNPDAVCECGTKDPYSKCYECRRPNPHPGPATKGESPDADPPAGCSDTDDAREAARRGHRPFPPAPSERPLPERIEAVEAPPEPEQILLRDPSGRPISLGELPDPAIGGYGPDGIP
jgi:hypothetical protein